MGTRCAAWPVSDTGWPEGPAPLWQSSAPPPQPTQGLCSWPPDPWELKCLLSPIAGLPRSTDLPVDCPGSPGENSAPPFSLADGLAAWRLGQGKRSFLSREPGVIFGHLGKKMSKRKKGVGFLPIQNLSVLRSPKVTAEVGNHGAGRQWAPITCDALPQSCPPSSSFYTALPTLPTIF